MTPTTPRDRPVRAEGLELLVTDVEVVVRFVGSTRQVALNPTAFAIWELCDGRTTVDEMVRAVWQLFDIDTEQAHADVAMALDRMRTRGLIR